MLPCKSLFRAGARSFSRPRAIPLPHPRLYSANPPASTSSPIEHDIKKLTSATSVGEIRTHYTDLVTKLKAFGQRNSYPTRKILSEKELYKILFLIARSSRQTDAEMLHDIILDIPLVLGLALNEDTHTAIIRGLIYRGDVNATRRWLLGMPKLTGQISPTIEHYHMLLKALPDMEACTLRLMRSIVHSMYAVGQTHETYEIVWLNRWKLYDRGENIIRPNTATALFGDMERDGLPYSPSFSAFLAQEYSKRGFAAYAQQVQRMYDQRFSSFDPSASSPPEGESNSRLARVAELYGTRGAIHHLKSWKLPEPPSHKQLKILLRYTRQAADIRLVEREFRVKCDIRHWSQAIVNNIRVGQLREALSIYDESKLAGIIPDAVMVHPLIHTLCSSSLSPSQEADIERALAIYQDLHSAVSSEENHADQLSGSDSDIYSALLHGLANVKNYYKYVGTAKKLMDDMAARGITYEDSSTATSIIALHMRNAANTEEALEVYRRFKSPLDGKGYTAVLGVFCKLGYEHTITIPSLHGYFEIVKDMRMAGFNTTVEVYTILLHQLATLASMVKQKADSQGANLTLEKLIRTTHRAHDMLSLDASLSPDAVLWNQLITTYQRLGCFADAYRLWEMIYISGQFDSVSVSCILDACAYANAYVIARRVIRKLIKRHYQFTSHNWNTWLECLCRFGKLDEAIEILCGESMGAPEGVQLDAENVRVVLKFASDKERGWDVLRQVKEKSPSLWDTLPIYLQNYA